MWPPATRASTHAQSQTKSASVAHIVPEYLPRSATFIYTLISHQTRFRPFVFAQATSHLHEFPLDQISVRPTDQRGRFERAVDKARTLAGRGPDGFSSWLAAEVSRTCCALIHAHFGWSGKDSVAAATRLGVPLVTTFYGRDVSEPARARLRDPYRQLFSAAGTFIVEGPAMADQLTRIGCDAQRIRIVPIGIALDQLVYSPRPRSRPLVIVQTGRFVEKKGFDVGIRAFAAARTRLGDSELWLIGDGELRPRLESLVDELGLRSSVRFSGMVSQSEYRTLVARADICLQPSRTAPDGDSEGGAPTVILEAQALGVPVVSTRHADIPFVVPRPTELAAEDDVEEVSEALLRVALESDVERRRRTDEARAFVCERHAAVVSAAAVEGIYDELIASRS